MYIVKADYKTRISTDLLNLVISESDSNGDDVLATASKIAEDYISTTAGIIYDFTTEFTLTGTARNFMVMQLALNIATYEVYQRIPDESVPQKVIKNYDDAIEDLKQCGRGKFPLNMPLKPITVPDTSTEAQNDGEDITPEGGGLRRISTVTRRSHRP